MCELNRRISQNSQRFFNKMNMENNEPVNLKFNKYWESSMKNKKIYIPTCIIFNADSFVFHNVYMYEIRRYIM